MLLFEIPEDNKFNQQCEFQTVKYLWIPMAIDMKMVQW